MNSVNPESRILICRLSAIGDCVLTMPVACALRDAFPEAPIAWLVQGGGAQLLRGHRAIDEMIVVPRGWLKSPRKVWSLRQSLLQRKFDIVIDPQSLTKSAAVGWLSAAPRRIGFGRPAGREIAPLLNNELVFPKSSHVVDRSLELLRPLGIRQPSVRFDLPQDGEAVATIDCYLKNRTSPERFVVMNPGAGWDSKIWPADRYGDVAKRLGMKRGLPSIVVWSGEKEKASAEEIVARSRGHAEMADSTSLPELAALLRRASFFVGSDTGPMHIAAAVGTPCVSLFGPTRPEECGPYGEGHETIQRFYQEGSGAERRGSDNRAMRAITVDDVMRACKRLVDQLESRPCQAVA